MKILKKTNEFPDFLESISLKCESQCPYLEMCWELVCVCHGASNTSIGEEEIIF